jgi:type IV secretory pathway TraG/TraD family ATPase VirD4
MNNNEDVLIGQSAYRGQNHKVTIQSTDRFRHTYMIGKTGTGKSTLYQNMAIQDINAGRGVCFVDPHGEAIEWIMERIPKNRIEDVILFDPSEEDAPPALNLLEWKTEAEKDFLASEAIQIFYKIFDPNSAGIIGPQFEHWMRNAALTVMSDPEGGTLTEIPRLFVDKEFEKHKRSFVTDPAVQEFWDKQMSKTADFHRSEMLNYFSSKFGRFITNRLMNGIISQKQSSFNFDDAVASEKIILINLSKGRIGDLNAQMLGLILMSKLQASIMKRAAFAEDKRPPMYLYVDEFQNLVTDAFASMLSESRKYGLAVHLTNQYIAQLPDKIRSAILGNVNTMIVFQIGARDADTLKTEMKPLEEHDLENVPLHYYYLKAAIKGEAHDPFLVNALPPADKPTEEYSKIIKSLSHLQYGNLLLR